MLVKDQIKKPPLSQESSGNTARLQESKPISQNRSVLTNQHFAFRFALKSPLSWDFFFFLGEWSTQWFTVFAAREEFVEAVTTIWRVRTEGVNGYCKIRICNCLQQIRKMSKDKFVEDVTTASTDFTDSSSITGGVKRHQWLLDWVSWRGRSLGLWDLIFWFLY